MRVLIQRLNYAELFIENIKVAVIDTPGIIVYAAIHRDDTEQIISKIAERVLNIRLFENAKGKFDKSISFIGGEILIVSQFTLYADTKNGRRPSFFEASPPEKAQRLYNFFVSEMRKSGLNVQTGVFGANMEIRYNNIGPVSIILDS